MRQSSNNKAPKGGRTRLTPADVRLIRALISERERLLAEARQLSNDEIGKKFGVGGEQIWKIATGRAWFFIT